MVAAGTAQLTPDEREALDRQLTSRQASSSGRKGPGSGRDRSRIVQFGHDVAANVGKLFSHVSVSFALLGGELRVEPHMAAASDADTALLMSCMPRALPAAGGQGVAGQLAALTDAQQAGLAELKAALEADPETLAALAAGGEVVDSAFHLRWLRGRAAWDLKESLPAVRSHAQWRVGTYADGRVPEQDVANELGARKVFIQGMDPDYRPIVIVRARDHLMGRAAETQRFIIYTLDAACAIADAEPRSDGRLQAIIDLSGLRLRNLDVGALKYIFDTLRHHYPDRLGRMTFLNAPGIFLAVWRCLAPNLNEVTRSRIAFASCAAARRKETASSGAAAGTAQQARQHHDDDDGAELRALFEPHMLPRAYGGDAEWVPVNEAAQALCRASVLETDADADSAAASSSSMATTHAGGGGPSWLRHRRLGWLKAAAGAPRRLRLRIGRHLEHRKHGGARAGARARPLAAMRNALRRFLLPGVWRAFVQGVASVVRWAGALPRIALGLDPLDRVRAARAEKLCAHALECAEY